jgi:phenylacetate-CoA ligase
MKFEHGLLKCYYKLPAPLQEIFSLAYMPLKLPSLLGGKGYIEKRDMFLKSQWWPRSRLEDYQLNRLHELLEHAYKNVPYYRRTFKKHGLKPEHIKSLEDLEKIPILTREDVARNFRSLIAKNADSKKLELCQTSGSTGKPISFYMDYPNRTTASAIYTRCIKTMGHKISDRLASLEFTFFLIRNEFVRSHVHNPLFRRLYLSSRAHNFEDLESYLGIIKKFKPHLMQGNPSVLYLLACSAEENGVSIRFRSFLSLFENLYRFQREKIRKVFGCEIFNYYCSRENIVSAMECKNHDGMHVDIERGIIETVDKNGLRTSRNKTGSIIATGLHNFAMPLIRYEIGDFGSISERLCSCGRESPLLKSLDGRKVGILEYGNRYIYPTTLSLLVWEVSNIKECQFVQENSRELTLKIVKRADYSDKDTKKLISLIKKVINDDNVKVSVHFTNFIPRTAGGKFEFVVKKDAALPNNH